MKKGFKKIVIIQSIEQLLNQGYTDKNKIIGKVMEDTGVDRPTIRRTMRDMRNDMTKKIQILQSDHYSLPK